MLLFSSYRANVSTSQDSVSKLSGLCQLYLFEQITTLCSGHLFVEHPRTQTQRHVGTHYLSLITHSHTHAPTRAHKHTCVHAHTCKDAAHINTRMLSNMRAGASTRSPLHTPAGTHTHKCMRTNINTRTHTRADALKHARGRTHTCAQAQVLMISLTHKHARTNTPCTHMRVGESTHHLTHTQALTYTYTRACVQTNTRINARGRTHMRAGAITHDLFSHTNTRTCAHTPNVHIYICAHTHLR